MLSNKAALGALAVLGVIAAGGGACVANRQQPEKTAEATHDVNLPATPGAVTETENSLTPAQPKAEPAQVPTPAVTEPVAHAPVRPTTPSRPTTTASNRRVSSRSASETAQQRTLPSSSTSSPRSTSASASVPNNPSVSPAVEPVENTTVERRQPAPEPPQKQYQELVVPAESVIGLQVDTALTSESAKVEDKVTARVTRDVRVKDQVAIPAGSRAEGSVTLVDKGGRLKDQAKLGIRFHTLVLADGTRLPINTETIYREGNAPARESTAKIGGGAVGGAVLGAILGGKKGAIIGTTVGAGAGGAAVAVSDPSVATLPAGSSVTVRMSAPATVTVEK